MLAVNIHALPKHLHEHFWRNRYYDRLLVLSLLLLQRQADSVQGFQILYPKSVDCRKVESLTIPMQLPVVGHRIDGVVHEPVQLKVVLCFDPQRLLVELSV